MRIAYLISWLVWLVCSQGVPVGIGNLDKGMGLWRKSLEELHNPLGIGVGKAREEQKNKIYRFLRKQEKAKRPW